MDYAKSSTIEIVAFKLNYFLTSAFLHWHFSFLIVVLTDFWWRKLVLHWSAFFAFTSDRMHVHSS
jgi:hypothetical protein